MPTVAQPSKPNFNVTKTNPNTYASKQTAPTTKSIPTPSAQKPSHQPIHAHDRSRPEPAFDDLLSKISDQSTPTLPDDRPDKVLCFLDRDDDFFIEVKRLQKAVVLRGEQMESHKMVQMLVDTGLVREEELRCARLSGGRTLVHLPIGLQVDTLLRALPASFWEKGYDAQPWTQLQDTELVIPRFKMILDLIDFPVCMWKEEAVKRAVAGLGVYLGSVPSPVRSDYSCWRVAIATPDLRRIPNQVGLIIGGIEHVSQIRPVIWEVGPIYKPTDFPEPPLKYPPPPPEQPYEQDNINMSIDQTSEASTQDGDDLICCSRKAMIEICMSLKLADIPPEIRQIITGRKGHGRVPLQVLRNMVDDSQIPD